MYGTASVNVVYLFFYAYVTYNFVNAILRPDSANMVLNRKWKFQKLSIKTNPTKVNRILSWIFDVRVLFRCFCSYRIK